MAPQMHFIRTSTSAGDAPPGLLPMMQTTIAGQPAMLLQTAQREFSSMLSIWIS